MDGIIAHISTLSLPQVLGYLGYMLLIFSYSLKTMIPLRIATVVSNTCLLLYAILSQNSTLIILNTILFPLNLFRLYEIISMVSFVTKITPFGDYFKPIIPFMKKQSFKANHTIFRAGEPADKLYIITKGEAKVVEYDITLTEGQIFGEIAIFSQEHKRTATITCTTDCELLVVSGDEVITLYYTSPQFSLYIIKMITDRLIEDALIKKEQLRPIL